VLEKYGAKCSLFDIGSQNLSDGTILALPPILFANLGEDPRKKTICIYGHLDVQPAALEDGWNTEPFKLIEKNGKLYGRGATDDKGPVIGWINVLEAFKTCNIELPVNIKFCFEGMEESGSVGLESALQHNRDWFKVKFLSYCVTYTYTRYAVNLYSQDVLYCCISDNYWLGTRKPCLTYGLRGLSYYSVEITCASQDLHSGIHGGAVHEAMSDLVYLLNNLVDKSGKILIPHVYDQVAPVTDAERGLYDNLDFDA
uniref:Cytosolic non-specific dipeptidase n=1 Tax=Romanomermis culicivorax TaxID=13658 RepID=A0A915K6K2_ROMCU